MQKPIVVATSAALFFTGCHTKSPTWQKVMATPRATGDAEQGDRAYAAELHHRLGATPHKVVTFEYDYFSKTRGAETGHRTAVVYFDDRNARQPWWVMDQTLDKPVWVPNKPLPQQVIFFARRPARVVEVHDYTVTRDKVVHDLEPAKRPVGTSTLQRASRAEPAERTAVFGSKAPVARPAAKVHPARRSWRFWEKPAAAPSAPSKKETAITHLEPAKPAPVVRTTTAPARVKSETKAAVTKTEAPKAKKTSQPKAASPAPAKSKPVAKEPAKAASEEKKPEKLEEKAPATAPVKTDAAAPANDGKKPVPAAKPKRQPLFHREKDEPVTPPPAGNGAAERPRRNLLQRILGSLNPANWFRKTA